MRKILPRLLLALCAGLPAAGTLAAPLNILGFDDMSCAAWNASKGDPDLRASYVVWVRGFLTDEPEFQIVPPGAEALPEGSVRASGWVRTLPSMRYGERAGMDGFFTAAMRRRG